VFHGENLYIATATAAATFSLLNVCGAAEVAAALVQLVQHGMPRLIRHDYKLGNP
jgi:hypothetical protein